MLLDYAEAALTKARYSIVQGRERYFGQVPGLRGVWATGRTLAQCRGKLREVIDGWIVVRLQHRLKVPAIGKYQIKGPKRIRVGK